MCSKLQQSDITGREAADRTIARARHLAAMLSEDLGVRISPNCDDLLVIRLLHEYQSLPTAEKEIEAILIWDWCLETHEERQPKFTAAMKHMMRPYYYLIRSQGAQCTKLTSYNGFVAYWGRYPDLSYNVVYH